MTSPWCRHLCSFKMYDLWCEYQCRTLMGRNDSTHQSGTTLWLESANVRSHYIVFRHKLESSIIIHKSILVTMFGVLLAKNFSRHLSVCPSFVIITLSLSPGFVLLTTIETPLSVASPDPSFDI